MKTQSWSDDDVAEAIWKSWLISEYGEDRLEEHLARMSWERLPGGPKKKWLAMARAGLEVIGL